MASHEKQRIVFAGFGAASAIGLTGKETANAVLSQCSRISFSRKFTSPYNGEPIVLSGLEYLESKLSCTERMIALADYAIRDLYHNAAPYMRRLQLKAEPLPLLISLPMIRPGLTWEDLEQLADRLSDLRPEDWPPGDTQHSGAFCNAGTGFSAALREASALIHEGKTHGCIVGAMDSPFDSDYLHWIGSQNRLKNNQTPFGMIPGESAVFCLLTHEGLLPPEQTECLVLHSVEFSWEHDLWYEGKASQGLGLTQAINQAIGADQIAGLCYVDLNGETWRSSEFDFAYLRNGAQFAHPLDIRHPAEIWGDVGAATGGMLTMLACHDLNSHVENASTALICTSADFQPWRAAHFIERAVLNG